MEASNLPPALSLPPEILSEIFLHLPVEFPAVCGRNSPLVLGLVCTYWRNVALSTPTLWSSFTIDEDTYPQSVDNKYHDDMLQWQLELLALWLERSGGAALSFEYSSITNATLTPSPSLLHELLRHAQRWKHVAFFVSLDVLDSMNATTPHTPLLNHLTISPYSLATLRESQRFTLAGDALQLTHVVLGECFVPSVMGLPWSQLTHIHGRCLYEHECIYILRLAVNLIHCDMHIVHGGDVHPDVPIVLSHLRRLEISFLHISDALMEKGDLRLVTSLISRSNCVLRELRLCNTIAMRKVYREVLPSTLNVTFV
ncbi:hypothetical protein C8F01DRAFT_1255659 [Mycena amicta]|nr:hypothetical protein C8F01DRAFT_1255659 [Mycena amicta]